MTEPFNPLAVEDDPFDEPAEDTDFLPIAGTHGPPWVIDVARADERKRLIAAMQAAHRKVAAWLMSLGVSAENAIDLGMGVVLYGLDWERETLP